MDKVEYKIADVDLSNCDREQYIYRAKYKATDSCLHWIAKWEFHTVAKYQQYLDVRAEQILGQSVSVVEELLKTSGAETLISS
jgi:hypothetical protein